MIRFRFWLAILLILSWIVIIAAHAHAQDKPRVWRVCVMTADGMDDARCRRKSSLPWLGKELPQTSLRCPQDYQMVSVFDDRAICVKETTNAE